MLKVKPQPRLKVATRQSDFPRSLQDCGDDTGLGRLRDLAMAARLITKTCEQTQKQAEDDLRKVERFLFSASYATSPAEVANARAALPLLARRAAETKEATLQARREQLQAEAALASAWAVYHHELLKLDALIKKRDALPKTPALGRWDVQQEIDAQRATTARCLE